jgi:hypothetical protein
MNLIKQFMKIGGFRSLPELEAYGEENFFRDFPEAKKLAMGGTPEAFPQIATADKFFSYGVPVPPTYHRDGGATGLPNIYPQIQSEQQFFAPVYTNSNNAYKAGGSYGEAFPQAVSYPNHGWGKTNYFMLESGGSFPPGMPQYTGMLPVMQNGAGLSGIDARTQQDMNHYYNAYPMMNGGQPSLQGGGESTDNPDQSLYVNKMQNFIRRLQQNGQKALENSIKTVDENPPMSGMRWGGIPKYQSKNTSGQVDLTDLAPGSMLIDPNNPNYKENLANYDRSYGVDGLGIFDTPSTGTGSGSAPAAPKATAPVAKPKSNRTTSGGVSTSTNTKARTTEELKAEVEAEKKKQQSGTIGPPNSWTQADWDAWLAERDAMMEARMQKMHEDWLKGERESGKSPSGTTGNTTTTGTTDTDNTTMKDGWHVETLADGTRVVVDSKGNVQYGLPSQSSSQSTQSQQQANYNNFLDYIPGGGLRRKSANALLGYALAGADLRGYIPTNIKTRSALLPGNRIKSFDLVKQGVGQSPYQATLPTEPTKTTQVPTIQDEGTFQSAMPTMTTDQKVQTANDWNYRPNQPSYMPAAPVIGPEGPVKTPVGPTNGIENALLTGAPSTPVNALLTGQPSPMTLYSDQQSNPMVTIDPIGSNVQGPVLGPSPYIGTEVNTGGSATFDKNNPQHREAMLRGIMEGMRYGGPYALPMFQTDVFSGENSNILSGEMPPFDGAVRINAEANNTQNMYWDTHVNDLMDQQAREIEKEADPFKATDKIIKDLKIKRKGLFADADPDQMIAGIDSLTGFLQKFRPREKPLTAYDVHGAMQTPVDDGSYVTNPSGMGLHFKPTRGNPNVHGMYAYDLPVAAYGGQGFYTGDNYYLTMPTIKNVKKAGAFKPGK